MTIEAALQNFVSTDPDTLALIYHQTEDHTPQEHMFPEFATAKAVAPYIVYRRSATDRLRAMAGPVGHAQATFILACWATTYDGAMALAEKVRIRLDGAKGTWNGIVVEHCHVLNESDAFEPSPELLDKQYYGRQLTVEIQHNE